MKIRTTKGKSELIDDAGNVVPGAVVYETTAERHVGASALVRLAIEDVEHDGVPFFEAAHAATIANSRATAVAASFSDLSTNERVKAVSLMSDVAPELFGDPEG